jgi:hypothetical protein
MSHIRHIVVRSQRDDSRVRPGVVSLEPLLLFEYDPCWERRWKEAFQRLKVARQAYEAASDEGAELSIVAQLKSLLARREVEITHKSAIKATNVLYVPALPGIMRHET